MPIRVLIKQIDNYSVGNFYKSGTEFGMYRYNCKLIYAWSDCRTVATCRSSDQKLFYVCLIINPVTSNIYTGPYGNITWIAGRTLL